MPRLQATRLYRREFLKALVAGKDNEEAAEDALQFVKRWYFDRCAQLKVPDEQRDVKWGDWLEIFVEWGMLLKDIPIDASRLPATPPLEPIEPSSSGILSPSPIHSEEVQAREIQPNPAKSTPKASK